MDKEKHAAQLQIEKEPYFFNSSLSSEQLEDWLNKQKLCVSHYNKLKRERAALVKQLAEIDAEVDWMLKSQTNSFPSGKLSFPLDPSPLLKSDYK